MAINKVVGSIQVNAEQIVNLAQKIADLEKKISEHKSDQNKYDIEALQLMQQELSALKQQRQIATQELDAIKDVNRERQRTSKILESEYALLKAHYDQYEKAEYTSLMNDKEKAKFIVQRINHLKSIVKLEESAYNKSKVDTTGVASIARRGTTESQGRSAMAASKTHAEYISEMIAMIKTLTKGSDEAVNASAKLVSYISAVYKNESSRIEMEMSGAKQAVRDFWATFHGGPTDAQKADTVLKQRELLDRVINAVTQKQIELKQKLADRKPGETPLISKSSFDLLTKNIENAKQKILQAQTVVAAQTKVQANTHYTTEEHKKAGALIVKNNDILNEQRAILSNNVDLLKERYSVAHKLLDNTEKLKELGIEGLAIAGTSKQEQETFLKQSNLAIKAREKLNQIEQNITEAELAKGDLGKTERTRTIIAKEYLDLLNKRDVLDQKLEARKKSGEKLDEKEVNRLRSIEKLKNDILAKTRANDIAQGRALSTLDKIHAKHKGIMSIMGQRIRFIATAGLAYKAQNNFVDMFKKSLTEILKLEREIAEIGTLQVGDQNVAQASLTKFKKGIIELSEQYGDDTSKLTKALYDIRSATIPTSKALGVLEVAAKAGKASLTDAAVAIKPIIGIMNAYQMAAEDAEKVSDMLFATIQRGVTTMKELAPNIGKAIAAAAMVGVDASQVLAMVASTTRMGVSTRETITAINRLMLNFSKQTEAAQLIAMKYGFSLDDIKNKKSGLIEVFNKMKDASDQEKIALVGSVRAFKAMAAGIIDAQNQMFDLEYIRASAGRTQDAYTTIAETIQHKTQQMQQVLHAAMLQFGDLLMPILQDILDWAEKLQSSGMVDMMKDITTWVAAALGAFAGFEVINGAAMALNNFRVAWVGLQQSFAAAKFIGFKAALLGTSGWAAALKILAVALSIVVGLIAKKTVKAKFDRLEAEKAAKQAKAEAKEKILTSAEEVDLKRKEAEQLKKLTEQYKELEKTANQSKSGQEQLGKVYDSIIERAKLLGIETKNYGSDLATVAGIADDATKALYAYNMEQKVLAKMMADEKVKDLSEEFNKVKAGFSSQEFTGVSYDYTKTLKGAANLGDGSIYNIYMNASKKYYESLGELRRKDREQSWDADNFEREKFVSSQDHLKAIITSTKEYADAWKAVVNAEKDSQEITTLITDELAVKIPGKDTEAKKRSETVDKELDKFLATAKAKRDALLEKTKKDFLETIEVLQTRVNKDGTLSLLSTNEQDIETFKKAVDAYSLQKAIVNKQFDIEDKNKKASLLQQRYELGLNHDIQEVGDALAESEIAKLELLKLQGLLTKEELQNRVKIVQNKVSEYKISQAKSIMETDAYNAIKVILAESEKLTTLTGEAKKRYLHDLRVELTKQTEFLLIQKLINIEVEKLNKSLRIKKKNEFENHVINLKSAESAKYIKTLSDEQLRLIIERNKVFKLLSESEIKHLKKVKLQRSAMRILGVGTYQDESAMRADIESQTNELIMAGIDLVKQHRLDAIEEEKQKKLDSIDDQLEKDKTMVAGQILTAAHRDRVFAAMDKKAEKEKEKAEKRAADKMRKEKKRQAIFDLAINTAQGIVATIATVGLPAAVPFIAALLAISAAQLALINNTKFAKGGYTGFGLGQKDETGQRQAGIVHEKEFVMNRNATKNNVGTFYAMQEALSNGKSFANFAIEHLTGRTKNVVMPSASTLFARGGYTGTSAATTMNAITMQEYAVEQNQLLKAVIMRLNMIESYNAETSEYTRKIKNKGRGI